MRQRRAVDPLRADDVDVVEGGELLRREGLRRTPDHVAGIVDDDVQTAGFVDDAPDGRLDGDLV